MAETEVKSANQKKLERKSQKSSRGALWREQRKRKVNNRQKNVGENRCKEDSEAIIRIYLSQRHVQQGTNLSTPAQCTCK